MRLFLVQHKCELYEGGATSKHNINRFENVQVSLFFVAISFDNNMLEKKIERITR